MGINIGLYKLGDERDEDGYLVNFEDVSDREGWDFGRCYGDTNFPSDIRFYIKKDREGEIYHTEHDYQRPASFVEARNWVKKLSLESPLFPVQRWLDVFDKMEKDKTLYFFFSR